MIRAKRIHDGPLTEKTKSSDGEAEDYIFVDATYDQDSQTQDGQTTVADDDDPGN